MNELHNETPKSTSQGLAIAAMVCAIVGLILTLTVIGSFIGVPLMVIALVLGIISLLMKKGGKGMAITGVVISTLGVIGVIAAGAFVGNVAKDVFPIVTDFASEMEMIIENDPELAELMEDPVFKKKVENLTEEKLMKEFSNIDEDDFDIDQIGSMVERALDTYKESLEELKEEHLIELGSE